MDCDVEEYHFCTHELDDKWAFTLFYLIRYALLAALGEERMKTITPADIIYFWNNVVEPEVRREYLKMVDEEAGEMAGVN